jgi:hypothetical protein
MSNLDKPVKVKAEVMWCFHNKPNEMSGKYQLDLCNLSNSAVTALEGLGLEVRKREDKPEKGFFITAKSNNPIKAFDETGKDLATVAIGNGSTAVAVIGAYEWSWKNKKGTSATIKKLVIEDLKEYEGSDNSQEDDVL